MVFGKKSIESGSDGYALIVVIMLLAVVSAMLATNFVVSNIELRTVYSSKISQTGFNAAEAGLNVRAEKIKDIFLAFKVPTGASPADESECPSGGSGDLACEELELDSGHSATTYVTKDPTNPTNVVIPPGEPYSGLVASEYRYSVNSIGHNKKGEREAALGLTFRTRLVPLFQFLNFFDDDLEMTSGGTPTYTGRIHSNHNIYFTHQSAFFSGQLMTINGPISAAKVFWRGPKFQTGCNSDWTSPIRIFNLSSYTNLPSCPSSGFGITDEQLVPYNGNALQKVPELKVPSVNTFKSFSHPETGSIFDFTYWESADVRFVLKLKADGTPDTSASATGIVVVESNDAINSSATSALNNPTSCPGGRMTGGIGRSVGVMGGLRTGSEGGAWNDAIYHNDPRLRLFRNYVQYPASNLYETVLDVEVGRLLDCISSHHGDFLSGGRDIDDDTDGGLVLFFAVQGPLSESSQNNYAVRFVDGARLQAFSSGHPAVKGLTMVTDQQGIVKGSYNSEAPWIPAAIISDMQYVLSNNWRDYYPVPGGGANTTTNFPDPSVSGTPNIWGDATKPKSPTCRDSGIGGGGTAYWEDCTTYFWRFTGTQVTTINAGLLTGMRLTCNANEVSCSGGYGISNGGPSWFFSFNEAWYDNYIRLYHLNYNPATNSMTATSPYSGWLTTWTLQPLNWTGSGVSLGAPKHNSTLMMGSDETQYWSAPQMNYVYDTRFNDPTKLPPLTPQAVYNRQELFDRHYDAGY